MLKIVPISNNLITLPIKWKIQNNAQIVNKKTFKYKIINVLKAINYLQVL